MQIHGLTVQFIFESALFATETMPLVFTVHCQLCIQVFVDVFEFRLFSLTVVVAIQIERNEESDVLSSNLWMTQRCIYQNTIENKYCFRKKHFKVNVKLIENFLCIHAYSQANIINSRRV